MPGRATGLGDYRYAYNGMETDAEVTGDYGNSYTTEFRQYDPRLMRWKSLDPLMQNFPMMSPYCAFDNNPIFYTDPFGLASEGGKDKVDRNKRRTYRNADKNAERFAKRKNGTEYDYNDGSRSVSYVNDDGKWESVYFKQRPKTGRSDTYALKLDALSSEASRDKYNKIIPIVTVESEKLIESRPFDKGMGISTVTYEVSYVSEYSPWQKMYSTATISGPLENKNEVYNAALALARREIDCQWCTDVEAASQGLSAGFGMMITEMGVLRIFRTPSSSVGLTVLKRGTTNSGGARIVIQKGDRIYDITKERVKEYIKNDRNPNAVYGDAVNFKKYGTPEGSTIIQGAGKGHKRTPTQNELNYLK